MKSATFDYLAQERVIYGRPAAEALLEEADRIGAERLFVVSAKSLSRKTDAISALRVALGDRFVGLFDDCVAHTPRDTVIAAADAIRAAGADLVVTVGGGTPIDTVKAALICLAEDVRDPGALAEYRIQVRDDGSRHVPAVRPMSVRQIVIPTTLSGAEFSDLAGVTDPARGIKDGYTARDCCAVTVILDPAFTVHTPEWLWLSTAIRSVDHAVETICSRAPQVLADATSAHALGMFADALPRIKETPDDLEARLDAQLAVWLATTGLFRVEYGASHGIGHQLGAVAGVPHGYCSCVMLPSVLRYNEPVNAERQVIVSEALGRPGDGAADAVHDLVEQLGLPTRLRDVGVERSQLDRIAEGSLENFMTRSNPRPLRSAEQIREILEMAW